MICFYSPSSRGFYIAGINAEIPADAVEISAEEHAALLAAQADGKVIRPGEDGAPVAVDPPAIDVTADMVKAEANRRLAPTDWYVIRLTDSGVAVPATVAAYRSAVRAASGGLETMVPIPVDYRDDSYWPASE